MCATDSRAGAGPSGPFGAQMMILQASDATHKDVGFGVCPPGFRPHFDPIIPVPLFVLFGMEMFTLCRVTLKVCNLFFFLLYRNSVKRLVTVTGYGNSPQPVRGIKQLFHRVI